MIIHISPRRAVAEGFSPSGDEPEGRPLLAPGRRAGLAWIINSLSIEHTYDEHRKPTRQIGSYVK